MRSYGYIKTENLESYSEYKPQLITLPAEYKLKDIGKVWDQGSVGSCVSHSIAEMYNFYQLSHGKTLEKKPDWLYYLRADKTIDGMMPAEGFELMKTAGEIKIFSRISTIEGIKHAVITNGPAFIAVIVRDGERDDFWNGSENLGGHAISIVGFSRDGFMIKNSWGYGYAESGFSEMSYEDAGKVIREAWTIIE